MVNDLWSNTGSGFMAHDFNLNVDVNLNKLAHRNHIKGCAKVNLN